MLYMKGLSQIEKLISQFVEEPFVRLFSDRLLPQVVASHLVHALEDGEIIAEDGIADVPGCYIIYLNPADLTALSRDHPQLNMQLQLELQSLADKMGVRLREAPEIILEEDRVLPPQAVRITSVHQPAAHLDRTRDLDMVHMQKLLNHAAPCAYLIVEGKHTVDLNKPLIRLGRALDNDIILEDRRVSRYHAQLRLRYGRYLLHDMGSTGGTTVNGFPAQEIVLHAGDTISLSGVDLIYAEDQPACRQSDGSTMPMTSIP